MSSPHDAAPYADHGFTIQQLDHAGRWQIIKHVGTHAEADVMLDYYRGKDTSGDWRIVAH